MDWTRFDRCRVRPYPRWPLICIAANRLAFPDKPSLMAWLKKCASEALLYRSGKCKACGMIHHECKPGEASGQSNGKGFRAAQWVERKKSAKAAKDEKPENAGEIDD